MSYSGYRNRQDFSHNRKLGLINYDKLHYNKYKSFRNRQFMNSFENEFNRGFRPKYQFNNAFARKRTGNPGYDGPRRPSEGFRNWNNVLSKNFRPDFRIIYRKICFNTIQDTNKQD